MVGFLSKVSGCQNRVLPARAEFLLVLDLPFISSREVRLNDSYGSYGFCATKRFSADEPNLKRKMTSVNSHYVSPCPPFSSEPLKEVRSL
jgi:hypothetical protein